MSQACQTTCHVMVLEDEIIVSSLIEMILQDQGWSVDGPFRTNRVALAYLEKERPDAALIDFNIADGTSAATASRLLELGIPFIVVSGYPKSMARSEVLRVAPWLDKPFSEDAVLRCLSQALDKAQPAA
ncbi:MAG: Signal transduction histidine kinase [Hyphomicrobiales bacterium]|nr:Signal transduction histidine kinase [Hyphomicrobiales bacterium]